MKTVKKELWRYGVNGLAATAVHYAVLLFILEVLNYQSAGIANLVAACFGIVTSYLGSRYYVFKNTDVNITRQVMRFSALYASIALVHGFILWLWTDIYGLSYHFGFLMATSLQVSLSYFGNKFLVFKQ